MLLAQSPLRIRNPNRQKEKSKPKYRLKRIKRFPKKENRISRLALSESSRIANIQITFETSTNDVTVSGINGFTVIGDAEDGKVVLGYLNANGELFSSAQSADIAKITVNAENATLKITDVKVSGWDTDKTVKYGKVNGIDPSEATFTDALPMT